jgi:hypothetical protein
MIYLNSLDTQRASKKKDCKTFFYLGFFFEKIFKNFKRMVLAEIASSQLRGFLGNIRIP